MAHQELYKRRISPSLFWKKQQGNFHLNFLLEQLLFEKLQYNVVSASSLRLGKAFRYRSNWSIPTASFSAGKLIYKGNTNPLFGWSSILLTYMTTYKEMAS